MMINPNELQRQVRIGQRDVIIKRDPVYPFWTIWNAANNFSWPEKFTSYDLAYEGAVKLFSKLDKPKKPKKVHLTPREPVEKKDD